ncbi:MAG: four helix bundle protein, partial [Myxococcales bacterium]
MFSFQKLDVYRRAVEFVALTQRIANEVPKGNAALLDQLRRAASSIPLNIAEA